MSALMSLDWQTLATLAIGAVAFAYLARRWWPALIGLVHPSASKPSSSGGCGAADTAGASQGASCSSGCGNCGHAATPAKDHRIRIVRKPAP